MQKNSDYKKFKPKYIVVYTTAYGMRIYMPDAKSGEHCGMADEKFTFPINSLEEIPNH